MAWQELALMVNSAAPSPRHLGLVNGVAMTTSMASRLFGPIVAGAAISYFGVSHRGAFGGSVSSNDVLFLHAYRFISLDSI